MAFLFTGGSKEVMNRNFYAILCFKWDEEELSEFEPGVDVRENIEEVDKIIKFYATKQVILEQVNNCSYYKQSGIIFWFNLVCPSPQRLEPS